MNKNKINQAFINIFYFLLPIAIMSSILIAILALVEIYKF